MVGKGDAVAVRRGDGELSSSIFHFPLFSICHWEAKCAALILPVKVTFNVRATFGFPMKNEK
jgi:hypothetical protein